MERFLNTSVLFGASPPSKTGYLFAIGSLAHHHHHHHHHHQTTCTHLLPQILPVDSAKRASGDLETSHFGDRLAGEVRELPDQVSGGSEEVGWGFSSANQARLGSCPHLRVGVGLHKWVGARGGSKTTEPEGLKPGARSRKRLRCQRKILGAFMWQLVLC